MKKINFPDLKSFIRGIVLGVAIIPLMLYVSGLPNLIDDAVRIVNNMAEKAMAKSDQCMVEEVTDPNVEFVPERIVIPNGEIDLPVISVPLVGGTWVVNDGTANYAEGTSLVSNMGGNVGIYAHDTEPNFGKIKHLTSGDKIEIYGQDKKATYEVVVSQTVEPSAVEVFYPTTDAMVSLVTCEGEFSEQRFYVQAKMLTLERITCGK